MEFLLEIILELVLEGTSELIKSKKASLWVRIPAACLFLSFSVRFGCETARKLVYYSFKRWF